MKLTKRQLKKIIREHLELNENLSGLITLAFCSLFACKGKPIEAQYPHFIWQIIGGELYSLVKPVSCKDFTLTKGDEVIHIKKCSWDPSDFKNFESDISIFQGEVYPAPVQILAQGEPLGDSDITTLEELVSTWEKVHEDGGTSLEDLFGKVYGTALMLYKGELSYRYGLDDDGNYSLYFKTESGKIPNEPEAGWNRHVGPKPGGVEHEYLMRMVDSDGYELKEL